MYHRELQNWSLNFRETHREGLGGMMKAIRRRFITVPMGMKYLDKYGIIREWIFISSLTRPHLHMM